MYLAECLFFGVFKNYFKTGKPSVSKRTRKKYFEGRKHKNCQRIFIKMIFNISFSANKDKN